jgi:hypothetical protein
MNRFAVLLTVVAAALVVPGLASASPANDGRNDAATLGRIPAVLAGSVASAHLDDGESSSPCALSRGSVWYRINATKDGRVVARLHAHGDLDATIDVYERVRSRQRLLACDVGDRHGNSAVAFNTAKGDSYLVRVSRRAGSVSDSFTLAVSDAAGVPRSAPPLPPGGVGGRLDRVARTDETWGVRLVAGRRYRFALRHPGAGCLGTALYAPRGAISGRPVATLGCEGYALYTPRRSGRYTLLVHAAGNVRGSQRYHLQAGFAESDDSAPGVALGNYSRAAGGLGGLDRVDLYRFDVVRRSVLFLNLQSPAELELSLLDAAGKVITHGTTQSLHKGLHRGRYFVAVRGAATTITRYRLLRASRTITKSSVHVAAAELRPGVAAVVQTITTPGVGGPVTVTFEEFDPLSGWQFARAVHGTSVLGNAIVRWVPPSVGRWRVTATYDGTRGRAPSVAGFARFEVAEPAG